MPTDDSDALRAEIEALQRRLTEAEDHLRAIHAGEVDALVVGDRLFVLDGVDAALNRFRSDVMEQIDDAVIATDPERRVFYFNAAAEQQYGIAASEVLGHPLTRVYEAIELQPGDFAAAEAALVTTGSWRGRSTHVKGSGARIEVESAVTAIRDAGGLPAGLLAVVRDVTERVEAERSHAAAQAAAQQALEAADRRKDEFLATLAHELRNPLAPIRNALQIVRLSDEQAVRDDALRIIGRQLQQMVHLVDDLLDVSRISQGKVELRRERVDVAAAVRTAVETSRPLIDAGRHTLTLELPAPQTLWVDADLTRLCQIVTNLLNNAAKYTPPGGRIDVQAAQHAGDAVIRIEDSGVGIPPEMLPRVFDMFTQVDHTLERAQGGLGVGLALVKRLIELHGGTVTAHSDGADRGSRFVLRLPLLAPAEAEAVGDAAPAFAPRDTSRHCVLIADDNRDSAQTLAQVLELMGYRTLVAHDGLQACRVALAEQPDTVVLDIGMPTMSGLEAARRIRLQDGGNAVRLIALSGWGQDEDRRRSTAAGFDHHLVKPVEIDTLIALLSPAAA